MSSSNRRGPPFRAEHIGSLRRPQYLLQKRADFKADKCTAEQLREAEDKAIAEIVQVQREAGIKTITDGEFRRAVFFEGVFNNLEGMKFYPEAPNDKLMDYIPDLILTRKIGVKVATFMCNGKIRRARPFYKSQFEALKSLVTPEEVANLKITMCAPEWYHIRHGPHTYSQDAYKSDEEYFADVVLAYREELDELYAIGCRNIQFDDPLLCYFCTDSVVSGMAQQGIGAEALLNLYCKVYNDILAGKPADLNAGIHLCRGNFPDGGHVMEGSYDNIARKLFHETNFDCYYLEYDTERAGTFEPLKHFPPRKKVVLGIVSSKIPQLEDKAALKQRIRQAAELIAQGSHGLSAESALQSIYLSPQCGFSSSILGGVCNDEEMKEKLRFVVEVANEIWSDA